MSSLKEADSHGPCISVPALGGERSGFALSLHVVAGTLTSVGESQGGRQDKGGGGGGAGAGSGLSLANSTVAATWFVSD